MDLNKDVSGYFLSDAKDFLERYRMLSVKSTHIGWRCKLLIELLFSLECAMKAVIFLESTEDEKLTYKKAKKGSHKLADLYSMLSEKSRQAYAHHIQTDLKDFIVDTRYLLEGRIFFSENLGILDENYYNTIANPIWLNNVSQQVLAFIEYVDMIDPFVIKTMKFSDIDIEAEKDKYDRLKSMITTKKK